MNRPLGMVAFCYGGGLLLAEFFQPALPLLFAFSLILVVGSILFARLRIFLLWPLIVVTGWTNLTTRTAVISPDDLRHTLGDAPQIVSVRGTLTETPSQRVLVRGEEENWRALARVKVTSLRRRDSWQPALGQIAVTMPGILPESFFAGQTVEITGVVSPPPLPLAEGLFDFRTYLRRQGIYFQLQTESSNDWQVLAAAESSQPVADQFRKWARHALAIGIPAEDESLNLERALTLGDKTMLTEEVSEPFIRAATYHIFAVDGLRMAIIFGIFFTLFRVLGLPRVGCGLVLLPLIWFYTALTGWPASAIRATVMLTVVIGGWVFKRPSDLLNSLFAAALIILVWEPQQFFQAGFQLSFLVVLCMILILPVFEKLGQHLLQTDPLLPDALRPRWRKILDAPAHHLLELLFVSLAAWLGSIPLVAYYFHIFTPVSGPANVVAVPLCALVLVSNFISLLLAGWLPIGAELFNHAGWFLMECIRVTSGWFEHWPAAYHYVAAPSLFSTALYYAILLGVFTSWLFQPKWRLGKSIVLVLLSALWCVQWQHQHSFTRLTVLPLNGGSAVYFTPPGGRQDLLLDCGNSNSVQFVMKPFLRAKGVNGLPRLALSHGDVRHIGGVKLLASLFPIEQLATSSINFRSPAYRSAVKEFSSRQRKVNRGDQLAGWTVLHPNPHEPFPEADDNVLVLRGEFAGTRVLLLSDLGGPGQNSLLENTPDLQAEIVIACLPEQGEPLCEALLDAIKPRLIVITDSEFPPIKRASANLRERLAQRGGPVIFTRDSGAVEISLRPGHWQGTARDVTVSK